uniref:Solute carrier family 22 member 17-like n=1 Tax=Petromyzon marinus TaxID=7757 RepID=A0AAJ7WL56_PETMA|nr:solute carrier family 22 member 17-like [Petromyzon marinus]
MDYDSVMLRTGGMGRFQWAVLLLTWLPNVPLAFNLLSDAFFTASPRHHCRPGHSGPAPPAAWGKGSADREALLNLTVPWEVDPRRAGARAELLHGVCVPSSSVTSSSVTSVTSSSVSVATNGGPRRRRRQPVPGGAPRGLGRCSHGWEFEAGAEGLTDSIVTTWELVCESKWLVPLEQFSFQVGAVVGCVLTGIAGDRWGRRPVLLASAALVAVAGGAAALAVNPAMFSALRFLEGAALSGVFLALYVLRVEVSDTTHRLRVAMAGDLLLVAGQLLLPGVVLLCRHWRLLQGALAGPFLLVVACWRAIPESTRWLLATQQRLRARVAVQLEATRNGINVEGEDFAELDATLGGRVGTQRHSLRDVGRSKNILKNILILSFTTFIGNAIHHCFERNLRAAVVAIAAAATVTTAAVTTAAVTTAAVTTAAVTTTTSATAAAAATATTATYFSGAGARAAACLAVWAAAGRLGRRATLLLAAVGTGGVSLLQLALAQYLPVALVTLLSVLGLFSSSAMAILSVLFAAEIIPTVIRATGLGLVLCSGALGRLMVPVMDLHDNRGSFLFHVVLASLAVLAVLAIMLLPESKRKRLPDDLRQGDRYRRPPLFTATSFTFAGGDRGRGGGDDGGRDGGRDDRDGGRRRLGDVPLLAGAAGGGGGGGFAFLPADDDDDDAGADADAVAGADADDGVGPAGMRGGDRRLALEGHVVEAALLPPPPAPPGRSHVPETGAGRGASGGRRRRGEVKQGPGAVLTTRSPARHTSK